MSDPGDDQQVNYAALQTPRGSAGSGQLSFSSSSPSSASCSGSSSASSKSAVSECLSAWLNYFQILNGLCSSGCRLAQTIAALEQWGDQPPSTATSSSAGQPSPLQQPQQPNGGVQQYVTAWDDLARATAVATSTVKSHIVTVLQDFVTHSLHAPSPPTAAAAAAAGVPVASDVTASAAAAAAAAANSAATDPIEMQRIREHNQHLIIETTQTMINIQHQFCVASYESFSTSMCCFVCQSPVGCPHDDGCAMLLQSAAASAASGGAHNLHQSPKFGMSSGRLGQQQQQLLQQQQSTHAAGHSSLFASGSTSAQASSEFIPYVVDAMVGPSLRGSSPPIHGQQHPQLMQQQQMHHQQQPHHSLHTGATFFETGRGPLPNPGTLLGMKAPFVHRGGSRSPLNCPLFPLSSTQRRWSEAAAGAAGDAMLMATGGGAFSGADNSRGLGAGGDADGSMRRWSMPWEAAPGRSATLAAATHQQQHYQQHQQQQQQPQQLVAWHQTRVGPVAASRGPIGVTTTASQSSSGKSTGDRSHSITPDSVWHSGQESDGLAEAIQLLTMRSTRPTMAAAHHVPTPIGAPFIEESQSFYTSPDAAPVYEMWSDTPQIMPCIKFNNDLDDGHRKG